MNWHRADELFDLSGVSSGTGSRVQAPQRRKQRLRQQASPQPKSMIKAWKILAPLSLEKYTISLADKNI